MPFKFEWILSGVLETIFRILNIKSPYIKVTVGIVGRNLNADSSKVQRQLGWKTRVSYSEGMEKIKKWIIETYHI